MDLQTELGIHDRDAEIQRLRHALALAQEALYWHNAEDFTSNDGERIGDLIIQVLGQKPERY